MHATCYAERWQTTELFVQSAGTTPVIDTPSIATLETST
jgi:hypothetical protein